jgi:acyl-CoA thioesterase-1
MIQKFTVTVSLMLMLMSHTAIAQHIVAIGSSTVSGEGADPIDSAWLNLYGAYLTNLGLPVTITNLGYSGTTTFAGMPSSFATPVSPPQPGVPFLDHNITYALSLNPDLVLIAYPSNDLVLGYTITQYLSNLRTIYDSALALGKTAYVSTTQPRNDIGTAIRALQLTARDSILAEFPGHVLNFWDPLADPVTLGFKTGLTTDGIHPNNAGHQLLFQVVRDANIIPVGPLAIKLTDLRAIFQDGTVHLQWKSSNQTGLAIFNVQRSWDGILFDDRWEEQSKGTSSPADHSWTDATPLSGRSFYRVKITEQGSVSYSATVSILNTSGGWKIGKLYSINGSLWNVEILSGKAGNVMAYLLDGSGRNVLHRTLYVNPPSTILPMDLSALAAGEYFLQLTTPDGSKTTRAIQKR